MYNLITFVFIVSYKSIIISKKISIYFPSNLKLVSLVLFLCLKTLSKEADYHILRRNIGKILISKQYNMSDPKSCVV